jgi:RNA polymerase sigma factor (sigma-70 family)
VVDDAAIVARLVDGDVSALEHMYDEYSARLYTYARSLVPHAAEDALADTFLLANARISQLRDPSKLRPWLYAICRNECLRELRRDTNTELDAVTMNELRTEPEEDPTRALISAAYAGANTRRWRR